MIIYEIKNKINNKIYIGKHSKCNTNEEFQKSNYWGSGIYIKRAIQKEGIENFERVALIENITDENELDNCEYLWIKNKNSKVPNGYNLTDGGEGLLNPSEELRKQLSLSAIKTYKNGREAWHKNKKMDKNYSKAHSGKIPWNKDKTNIFTQQQLEKISNGNKGKEVSEKTKKKMSVSAKLKWKKMPNYKRTKEANIKTSNSLNSRILSKTYILKNLNTNEVVEINSGFGLFCEKNGLNKNHFYQILKGNRKTTKRWTISIKEESNVA